MTTTHDSDTLLDQLQTMDADSFESFVGELWERQGWTTTVSQHSNDAGIDVVATRHDPFEQKHLIQAKRYGPTTTVGSPDIQQYASLKQQVPDADAVVIVTTNRFTTHARDRATELNVKLINGNELITLIDEADAYDLLKTYLSATETTSRPSQAPSPDRQGLSTYERVQETARGFSWADISADVYLGFILIGTAAWCIGLLFGIAGINGGFIGRTAGVVAINSWIIFPIALYYEAARMAEATEWAPQGLLYAVGGGIPVINAIVGGYYLYRRRQICLAEENEELLVIERRDAAASCDGDQQ